MSTRKDLINAIVKNSIKQYGEGSASLMSSKSVTSIVKRTIPTSAPHLDRILAKDIKSRFGVPVGRIVGVSGKEASGKTTLLIMLMKAVQESGGLAILIETEHAFDPNYAEKLGLLLDELILAQPDYLEQALDMIKDFVDMFKEAKDEYYAENSEPWNVPMFIGLDSIAGVPPQAEYEASSFGDEQALGLHARRLSKFFRNISGLIANEQICLVCTNQLKTNTGVRYGNKDTEIGGAALKFHASIRLDIRRKGFIKATKTGDPIGIEMLAKTVKNKVMIPYKSVTVPIIFGEGISYTRSLFNALKEKKILKQSGSIYTLSYTLKEKNYVLTAKGKEKFCEKLKAIADSPRIRRKIEKKLDK